MEENTGFGVPTSAENPVHTIDENQNRVHLVRQVQEFLVDRQARGLSPLSVRWYDQQLDYFLSFTGTDDLTPALIRRYLLHLAESHNPGGVAGAFRALRVFLAWRAVEDDLANRSLHVAAPRVPRQVLDLVPLEHVRAMLAACPRDPLGDRDRALFLTLLDSGLRRSELLALDVNDLDPKSGALQVRQGKGGKWRAAFVSPQTLLAILRSRPPDGPPWLDCRGKRLTPSALRAILLRRAQLAGAPLPSPYQLCACARVKRLGNAA